MGCTRPGTGQRQSKQERGPRQAELSHPLSKPECKWAPRLKTPKREGEGSTAPSTVCTLEGDSSPAEQQEPCPSWNRGQQDR